MGERARVRVLRASQSAELRETFRQLSEIDGRNGPKFGRRVLIELAARVAGRTYEPMLFELCHLARAALVGGEGTPGGYRNGAGFEWLFWGVDEARPGAFRAAFLHSAGWRDSGAMPALQDNPPPRAGRTLQVGEDSVTLVYPDGRFEVRYARMPDLAAMMELLVSALGYGALAAAMDPLAAPNLDRDAVAGAARDLSRRFYAWLGDRLPAAQAQRKFHALVAFVEEARGAEFTEEDIDDELVLRFWFHHASGGRHAGTDGAIARKSAGTANADFRGYRTTFLAFLTFVRVLEEGADIGRLEHSTPIGTDFEAGEVEPAAEALDAIEVPQDDPLARLQEEPAVAVKALNRRELSLLQVPVTESDGVRRLPRSYLRAECFGPVQNRLSQALRRKAEAAELAAIAASGPEPGYRGRIAALEEAEAHLKRVAAACLYVLHRRAEDDRKDGGGQVTELDFRVLGEARRAFEGLNRAGFERSAIREPRLEPAYRALADALPAVSDRLRAVLGSLRLPAGWQAAEAEDRPIFARAFATLYGVAADDPPGDIDDEPFVREGGAEVPELPGSRPSGAGRIGAAPARPAGEKP